MLNFALPSRCNKKVKNFQNVVLQKTTKSQYLLNFENILNAFNFKCLYKKSDCERNFN